MPDGKRKYAIDTCSLIQLRRAYPLDVFPSVWAKVEDMADAGTLISIEDVYEELRIQDDEVSKWAKQHPAMFLPLDGLIQARALQVLSTHRGLVDLRKRKSGADPFVIAAALVYSCIVVTEEEPSTSPNKVKIPDVCKDYSIQCLHLLEMLRLEDFRL